MTYTRWLICLLPLVSILVCVSACKKQQPEEPPFPFFYLRDEMAPPMTVAELASRLRVICAESPSYQRLLRDATHACRHAASERPWTDVEPELEEQGFRRLKARDDIEFEYLAVQDAWVAGDGTTHELYLSFVVNRQSADVIPLVKPGHVTVAKAGLRCRQNRPYTEMLISDAYPEGSALFRALRLAEVAATAAEYSILGTIEIEYGFIFDKWAEALEQGFSISLTFADSVDDAGRWKRVIFSVPSGLDAPRDSRGKAVDPHYELRDSLGEFQAWGSKTWTERIEGNNGNQ